MCLSMEYFQNYESRKKYRTEYGVSLEEAVNDLDRYHTTIYPVANEMAGWIFENWTLKQVYQLPSESLSILFKILKKEPVSIKGYALSILEYTEVNNLTPIEAINLLHKLQMQIKAN